MNDDEDDEDIDEDKDKDSENAIHKCFMLKPMPNHEG